MTLKMSCCKSNSNTSYGSPGVRNQVEHKRNGPNWLQFSKIHCIIFLEGGGGSENNDFKNELLQIQF